MSDYFHTALLSAVKIQISISAALRLRHPEYLMFLQSIIRAVHTETYSLNVQIIYYK